MHHNSIRAKEKADVDQIQDLSVRGYFKDQAQYDQRFTKEQVKIEDRTVTSCCLPHLYASSCSLLFAWLLLKLFYFPLLANDFYVVHINVQLEMEGQFMKGLPSCFELDV
jgi:hypothetical protein